MSANTEPDQVFDKQVYLVTEDLEFLMFELHKKDDRWPVLDPAYYKDLQGRYLQLLSDKAFPASPKGDKNVKVRFHRRSRPHLCKPKDGSFWIALDDVHVEGADELIETTRVYDHDDNKLGIGLRQSDLSKLMSLRTKVSHVADKTGSQTHVVLADDGVYEGETIKVLLDTLDRFGVIVNELRFAFATKQGFDEVMRLKNDGWKSKRGLRPIEVEPGKVMPLGFLIDWVCERDFFAGAPRSGRTLGALEKGIPVPSAMPIGYPYIKHFADARTTASLPKGIHELGEFFLGESIALWNAIDAKRDRPLLVVDLPRFPGPGNEEVYSDCVDLELAAVEYLEHLEKEFYGSKAKDRRTRRSTIFAPDNVNRENRLDRESTLK